jgi:signal transduction histidine kinase
MCSRLSLIRDEAALEFQTIDLAQWVASVLAELKPGLGNRLAAELAPAGQVELDPGEFRKVLQNLVLNAQEALQSANWKPGSEPGEESAAAGQGENAPPIVVRTRPVDGWAVLEVQDRGCGMSREFVEERLFQPFQTTKPQGMGIGLFQSRHIVERHGGRIEVDSTPGMGTSFRVLLRQRSANG